MICRLCKGSGNLACFPGGKAEWWPCPACGEAGATVQYGRPVIIIHTQRKKKAKNK